MEKPELNRWILLRDIFIFQIKLAIDAVRDLLLSPVSVICALIDLFKGNQYQQSYFYKVMRLGRKTDHWLNLFGADDKVTQLKKGLIDQENVTDSNVNNQQEQVRNIDHLFAQVESLLKEQHGKGGLTASAKSSVDRYLDKILSTQVNNNQQAATESCNASEEKPTEDKKEAKPLSK